MSHQHHKNGLEQTIISKPIEVIFEGAPILQAIIYKVGPLKIVISGAIYL